ncbi:unnamed protein product, partial [Amoebophrya sp. A120]
SNQTTPSLDSADSQHHLRDLVEHAEAEMLAEQAAVAEHKKPEPEGLESGPETFEPVHKHENIIQKANTPTPGRIYRPGASAEGSAFSAERYYRSLAATEGSTSPTAASVRTADIKVAVPGAAEQA